MQGPVGGYSIIIPPDTIITKSRSLIKFTCSGPLKEMAFIEIEFQADVLTTIYNDEIRKVAVLVVQYDISMSMISDASNYVLAWRCLKSLVVLPRTIMRPTCSWRKGTLFFSIFESAQQEIASGPRRAASMEMIAVV